MRPGLVVSFVMLFLFFEAQGIRLEKAFQYYSVDDHQRLLINVETNKMISTRLLEVHEASGNGAARFEGLCRDGLCLSGRTRKLLSKGTSATFTTTSSLSNSSKQVDDHLISKQQESSKTLIKGNNNGKFLVNSKPISKHREVVSAVDRYPDIIDIAGMDYTTARRKSPIHN